MKQVRTTSSAGEVQNGNVEEHEDIETGAYIRLKIPPVGYPLPTSSLGKMPREEEMRITT